MLVFRILRGVLIRFLQAFAVPADPPVFYRRYFPLLVFLFVGIGAWFIWINGTPALIRWIDSWTVVKPVNKEVSVGVSGALVVAWISAVLCVLTFANVVVGPLRDKPLDLVVPETLNSWLAGAVAVGIGLLIGTSIFT